MTPLGARILDRLRRDPGRVVSILLREGAPDEPVTAARLVARACGLASGLADGRPVPEGSVAAICLYPGLDLHAAWLGALWAGFVPTMVAPPSPRMEPAKYAAGFRAMAGHIAARVWVVDREVVGLLGPEIAGVAGRVVVAADVPDAGDADPTAAATGDLDAVAVLQHSSGTTGLQKAIGLTSRQVFAHEEAYGRALELTSADTVVSWLPLYHDMGFVACFLMPLLRGMRLVELSPFEWVRQPLKLLDAIERHRGTLCWLPNFAFAFLAAARERAGDRGPWDLSSVRAWVNSSEPVLASSFGRFLAAYGDSGVTRAQLTASYAMAENVYAVTQSQPGHLREIRVDRSALALNRLRPAVDADGVALVSNGPVLPTTEVRVLGRDGEALDAGAVGEIALRGACRFSGYVGHPDLTAAAIDAGGWYHTGDLGALVDGELFVTGRVKDLVIIQGRNFYPGDIEAAAADVPGVAAGRVVAFGVPDDATGTERLVVLFEQDAASPDTGAAIALRLRAHIAQSFNCTAGDVRAVPPRWLVKSTSGKMARPDNRAKYLADVH